MYLYWGPEHIQTSCNYLFKIAIEEFILQDIHKNNEYNWHYFNFLLLSLLNDFIIELKNLAGLDRIDKKERLWEGT